MTIEQALNILCKKTYLVDISNEDNIIPLDEYNTYSIEVTKNTVYIIFDCDIKDGIPDIFKVSDDVLIETKDIMGVSVEKVTNEEEYKRIYGHMETFEKEANLQE